MEVLSLRIKALSASFRRPLDHNYQRTFLLPPPTTILGFVGASMGLSDKEMWKKDSLIRRIRVSVLALNKPGFAKDMWSIKKIKNNKIAGNSPYFREILFYPEFLLLFGGNQEDLNILEKAFSYPTYALSLGREDEIIRIESMSWEKPEKGDSVFHGTILPIDIRKSKYSPVLEEGIVMEPPVMEDVPLEFSIKNSKNVRIAGEKRTYSFIPLGLKIKVEENFAEVYSLNGRNFVWLNS